MDEFMDEFMDAMKELFPNLLVQFEDLSTDNAFKYLSRFRQKYLCFNDDVSVYCGRCPFPRILHNPD
jgi:malate dehydrogenase (oxaloacetate-decarboxylating)(NADP+)